LPLKPLCGKPTFYTISISVDSLWKCSDFSLLSKYMASNKFTNSSLFAYRCEWACFLYVLCVLLWEKLREARERREKNKLTVKFALHCFHIRECVRVCVCVCESVCESACESACVKRSRETRQMRKKERINLPFWLTQIILLLPSKVFFFIWNRKRRCNKSEDDLI